MKNAELCFGESSIGAGAPTKHLPHHRMSFARFHHGDAHGMAAGGLEKEGSFLQSFLSPFWNDLHSPIATCSMVLTVLEMYILSSHWSARELKGSSPLTHNRICLVSTVFQNEKHVNKSMKNVNAENGQAD